MTPRFFRLTIHREWVVKVTDDALGEDQVFDRTVAEFLNYNFIDATEMEPLDDAEVTEEDYGGEFWDYEVTE